jgi:hypothetical protein
MKLIDAWQDAAICEGFELGQSLQQVAAETGLSTLEVFRRQLELKLVPSGPTRDSDSNIQGPA